MGYENKQAKQAGRQASKNSYSASRRRGLYFMRIENCTQLKHLHMPHRAYTAHISMHIWICKLNISQLFIDFEYSDFFRPIWCVYVCLSGTHSDCVVSLRMYVISFSIDPSRSMHSALHTEYRTIKRAFRLGGNVLGMLLKSPQNNNLFAFPLFVSARFFLPILERIFSN